MLVKMKRVLFITDNDAGYQHGVSEHRVPSAVVFPNL
jgi:hypothetical protein